MADGVERAGGRLRFSSGERVDSGHIAHGTGTIESFLATLAVTYQPLDSDLSAIAALTTTTFGRALLTLADAAAMRSSAGLILGTDIYSKAAIDAGFQPLDSDLTAIAALTTTSFGRAFLTLADAAAAITTLGIGTYTSYTPALTSTGTAPTMNSGNRSGSYQQTGKKVVGSARLAWTALGAGEGVGTGDYRVSLPVAAAGTADEGVGFVTYIDAGVRAYVGTAALVTSTTAVLYLEGGVKAGAAAPVVPANSDTYSINWNYRAA